jgi:hypothetical protein
MGSLRTLQRAKKPEFYISELSTASFSISGERYGIVFEPVGYVNNPKEGTGTYYLKATLLNLRPLKKITSLTRTWGWRCSNDMLPSHVNRLVKELMANQKDWKRVLNFPSQWARDEPRLDVDSLLKEFTGNL